MNATDLLTGICQDWKGTIRFPKNARAAMFSLHFFRDKNGQPTFTAKLIREIVLAGGDWREAVKLQLANRPAVFPLPRPRVLAFKQWAEKLTARPVRGLLTWKGGEA
jgi:hypothetical protein